MRAIGRNDERKYAPPLFFFRRLTFITGRVDSGAWVPEVLALLASGKLDVGPVASRVAHWDDAAEATLDPGPKVVVVRPSKR